MGHQEDAEEVTVARFRLRQTDEVALADLDDYLGPDALFFKTFEPFMSEFISVDRLSSRVTVAEDS
jgi:hypothetical protein